MRILLKLLIVMMMSTLVIAQEMDEDMMMAHPDGLITIQSQYDVDETTMRLQATLEEAGLIVLTTVDHDAAAESVEKELLPTHLIIFGNPALGTQLMQENQAIGIDLPQKFLIYENAEGIVYVSYNDPDYLRRRFGVENEEVLATITGALANLSGSVADMDSMMTEEDTEMMATEEVMSDSDGMDSEMMDEVDGLMMENGLHTVESDRNFDDTVAALQSILEENGFRIPAVVDHAANAMNADLELRPTTLIIFGNPNVGTGLMQAQRSIAID
ncbi:MAG: DUF302 domain-containing protein, partial [Aggregatilineales bacterium]